MENKNFNKLKEGENSLKIDKDIIEIQKTIIFYGDKIIFRLDKIMELLQSAYPSRKDKETITNLQDPLVQLLQNMKIPKGYKNN
jgi:hypothetical protein